MSASAIDFGSLPYPDSNGLTQRDRDYFRMVRTENGFSDLVVVSKKKKEDEDRRSEGEGGGVQLEQVQINQRSAGEATPTLPPQRNEGEGIQGTPCIFMWLFKIPRKRKRSFLHKVLNP